MQVYKIVKSFVFAHFGHQIGKVANDTVNYFQLLRET